MATMPTFQDGYEIHDTDWNQHANQINTNTGAIATNASDIGGLDGRLATAEGDISTHATDIGQLQDKPYARYELTSQTVDPGAYTYVTLPSAVATHPEVTTSDNISFTLARPGLWLFSCGARTKGTVSASGRFLMHIDADVTTYGGGDSTKAGGSFPIGPYVVPVVSDGATTCRMGLYPPATVEFSSGTNVSFIWVAP